MGVNSSSSVESIFSTEQEYKQFCSKYEKLGKNLKEILIEMLKDEKIHLLDVQYRIKDYESYQEKIQRKSYTNPLEEVEDVCGLRVICYYPSDLERICQIISREFDVQTSEDKMALLDEDRFGYRSMHYIIQLKDNWANVPTYRELKELKAEIQIRTVLMHAWADIQHKLAYKKEEHIPPQFKRKLSQLSALFEIADEQFDFLRKEKEKYTHEFSKTIKDGQFDTYQPINLDSFQAFLNNYISDRTASEKNAAGLLDEINELKLNFDDLIQSLEKVKDIYSGLEQKGGEFSKFESLNQVGVMRLALDLTNEEYWQKRAPKMSEKALVFREQFRV